MADLSFYNNPDLADGFGSTAGGRPNPHRGLDFPHALGTPVPAYSPGVVVTSEWNNALGNIVQVRGDNGRYVGYRHLRSAAPRLPVGARVEVGTIVGQVSDTGSAAFGYHLCTTNSSNARGVYGESGVSDPWPYIQRAMNGDDSNGGSGGGGSDWYYYDPTGQVAANIQQHLKNRGRYSGPVDGIWGPETRKGVQRTIKNVGYDGPIDGIIEGNGARLIQVYAQKFGDYKGPIDRKLGPNSWAGFELGLARP